MRFAAETRVEVQGETADNLIINGKPLRTHTVIWTAGVANNPFYAANGFKLDSRGKVIVDQYLQAEPDVFVLGDNNNTQYSGMAQTALIDADSIASNLVRVIHDEKAAQAGHRHTRRS